MTAGWQKTKSFVAALKSNAKFRAENSDKVAVLV